MIEDSPKLVAPLIAPLTGDGPLARQIIDCRLLTMARSDRPAPLVNRTGLVEARYQDWLNARRGDTA